MPGDRLVDQKEPIHSQAKARPGKILSDEVQRQQNSFKSRLNATKY
jgi:hypothetical protein